MGIQYNDPKGGTPSSIGATQIRTDFYQKKALVDLKKEQYFSQLADVTSMPKNMGKAIKRFQYLPMLHDANLNDQGIDAAGVAVSATGYSVVLPRLVQSFALNAAAVAAAAAINAIQVGVSVVSGAGPWIITNSKVVITDLAKTTAALSAAVSAAVPGALVTQGSGNLYGSSKDIGTIAGKMPALSETGGRVNRVGFKRKELTASISKFGFFDEYTQESVDFDSDDGLLEHINREMLFGANELTEDALQKDLINAAGIVKYAGAATTNDTIVAASTVTYADLMRLSINLDNNRCPKGTTFISGSRMIDTKTIGAARIMYVGSEMLPTLKAMTDLFGNQAFVAVEKYAAAGNTVTGEVGAIDHFRIVVVPEMMKWSGAGGQTTEATHYDNGAFYDVFPMLVVGSGSFTTIGFQTDGKTVKFKITHKAPGEATADRNDPYGEMGFMSIKWYYGFMVLRAEWIALIKTNAKL